MTNIAPNIAFMTANGSSLDIQLNNHVRIQVTAGGQVLVSRTDGGEFKVGDATCQFISLEGTPLS